MNRRRTALVVNAAVWLSPLLSTSVSAHDVGASRFDAPIPLPLLFAGAAATVALTALVLGLFSTPDSTTGSTAGTPVETGGSSDASAATRAPNAARRSMVAPTDDRGRLLVTVPSPIARAVRLIARSVFFVVFFGAIAAGLFDTQAAAENLATTFVWPVWIRGVGLYAIAFTSPWRVLAPWRTLYDAIGRLEGTDVALLDGYPEWFGRWPALVGFTVLVGVLENLTIVPQSPRMTAAVVAGYAAFMLAGAVVFGSTWFERADAFAVFYDLLGRVAPVHPSRTDEGGYRITLRAPWRGCLRPTADLSLVTFAVVAVYTVSFDGFTNTAEFQRLLFDTRDALGLGGVVSVFLYLLGAIGFVGVFVAVSWVMGTAAGSGRRWREFAFAFAPTVLPIAAAYEVAHNYPYVARNLGSFVSQLSSVVTATSVTPTDPLGWLTIGLFWGSQVALIVAGHLIAVVAAHRVALTHSETTTGARRMHFPLVLLMIGYTVLSLWIISQPIAS